MNYLLPRYSTDIGTPVRVLKSLLEYDQFDDWLPDPVYYTDSLNAIQSVSARIENAWRDGAIQAYESSSIELPRSRGSPLLARKLPLEVRAAAHIVAAQLGPRLVKALPRDKVYGFRWLAGGPRVFDPPGQELRELFRLISRATAYTGKAAALIDVQGFNSAVLVEKFEAILKSIGARPDEAQFLLSLANLKQLSLLKDKLLKYILQ